MALGNRDPGDLPAREGVTSVGCGQEAKEGLGAAGDGMHTPAGSQDSPFRGWGIRSPPGRIESPGEICTSFPPNEGEVPEQQGADESFTESG